MKKIVACSLALTAFGQASLHSDTPQAPKQTIAQTLLYAMEDSFGHQSWSIGGQTTLEYTRSYINFLETQGKKPVFQARCFAGELRDNPIINADFSTLSVLTSHQTLNRDLSLVSGPPENPGNALIHLLGVAQSIPAKISLGFLLASPQTNLNLLRNRQNAIRSIANDEPLVRATNTLIQNIIANQKESTTILGERWLEGWGNPGGDSSFSILDLPIINKIGHSTVGKSLQYYSEHIVQKIAYVAKVTITFSALIYLAKQARIPLPKKIASFRQTIQNSIAARGEGIVPSSDEEVFKLLNFNPLETLHGTESFNALITLYLLVQLECLRQDTERHYAQFLQSLYFIKTMNKAAQVFTNIQAMYDQTKEHENLRKLPDLQPFYDFFEKNLAQNKELTKIFQLSKSYQMCWKYSPLKPSVALHLFELIRKNKTALNALMLNYGRLEVYLGCAQLYKTHVSQNNQFCFAEYVESQAPLY